MNSHVYLLPNAEGSAFKIGVSINPRARVQQIGAEFDRENCRAYEVGGSEQAFEIERKLHRVMEGWRRPQEYRTGNTEWFDLTCFPIALAICREFSENLGLTRVLGPDDLFSGHRKASPKRPPVRATETPAPDSYAAEVRERKRAKASTRRHLVRLAEAAKNDPAVLGYMGHYTIIVEGLDAVTRWNLAFSSSKHYRKFRYDHETEIGFIELCQSCWLYDLIPSVISKFDKRIEDAVFNQYGLPGLFGFSNRLSAQRREQFMEMMVQWKLSFAPQQLNEVA